MKSRFKLVVLSALSALTAFSTVLVSSCKEDKCKSIVCAYGGVCSSGQCICPSGYEGTQCETITRKRYLGVWNVTEDGTYSSAAQYAISLEAGANIAEVRIKNFRNSFVSDVQAFVKGDTITIPNQTLAGKTIRGFGYIQQDKYYGQNGKITMRYVVKDNTSGVVDDYGVDNGDPSLWNK
ncbi:MAG: calcium-binding EGF-like domain-containing protein [Bacteroidetes bacterium]|nr:calcium-binding EGF-like domain-containing protein [Bacteroidota bacterium]MBS1740561.1 calcium-binding EGF-like domain-containing protein [Bacteroidota bacterium]MBS1776190.1 calcium-binding EGF-like domain-containing protein [Bacteroidota bacterium]